MKPTTKKAIEKWTGRVFAWILTIILLAIVVLIAFVPHMLINPSETYQLIISVCVGIIVFVFEILILLWFMATQADKYLPPGEKR